MEPLGKIQLEVDALKEFLDESLISSVNTTVGSGAQTARTRNRTGTVRRQHVARPATADSGRLPFSQRKPSVRECITLTGRARHIGDTPRERSAEHEQPGGGGGNRCSSVPAGSRGGAKLRVEDRVVSGGMGGMARVERKKAKKKIKFDPGASSAPKSYPLLEDVPDDIFDQYDRAVSQETAARKAQRSREEDRVKIRELTMRLEGEQRENKKLKEKLTKAERSRAEAEATRSSVQKLLEHEAKARRKAEEELSKELNRRLNSEKRTKRSNDTFKEQIKLFGIRIKKLENQLILERKRAGQLETSLHYETAARKSFEKTVKKGVKANDDMEIFAQATEGETSNPLDDEPSRLKELRQRGKTPSDVAFDEHVAMVFEGPKIAAPVHNSWMTKLEEESRSARPNGYDSTCSRCGSDFDPAANHRNDCGYHSGHLVGDTYECCGVQVYEGYNPVYCQWANHITTGATHLRKKK